MKGYSQKSLSIYLILALMMVIVLSSCGVIQSGSIKKIALLAPFEGRYREVGYNALYAVRLALTDSQTQDIHLVAVDDGGTVESAVDRIQALNIAPDIEVILVLGQFASHPDVQIANDKPLIMIGHWGHLPADEQTLSMSNPAITSNITDITTLDSTQQNRVSDLLMLEQVPDLYPDLSQLEIISSGSLPDADFHARYLNSDLYVPEPNLLATLTYDVTQLIIEAIHTQTPINDMTYIGINGEIRFVDGYWQDAPIHIYEYQNGELVHIAS